MEYYQTGDLLLFKGRGCVSSMLKCCGRSKFSHIGMIVQQPDGVYLLESTKETGVRLVELNSILSTYDGMIYYRKVIYPRTTFFQNECLRVCETVIGCPYDENMIDWVAAKIKLDDPSYEPIFANPRNKKSFWCSALIAYMYSRIGLLPVNVEWSLIAPQDFTSGDKTLTFMCAFEDERRLF